MGYSRDMIMEITLVDPSKVSRAIWDAKAIHPLTYGWYSTTQGWKWEGGEALVTVCGHLPNVYGAVTVRHGGQISTVQARSVSAALRALGLCEDTKVA